MFIQPTTWLSWLQTNILNPWYDANAAKVRNVGKWTDLKAIFNRLAENKNLTVVSMSPVGSRIHGTFAHTKLGIALANAGQQLVARAAFTGVALKIDSSRLTSYVTKHVPALFDILRTDTEDEIKTSLSTPQDQENGYVAVHPDEGRRTPSLYQ